MAQQILTLNERIQATSLEEIITTLSLAVSLHDDFASNRQPIGRIKVSLQEQARQAIQNLSGYYFFMDVEDDTHTVQVASDYYFDYEEEVILSNLDPKNPVVDITLRPLPYYPFPPGTTLIKGVVKNSGGEAISDATVRVLSPALETQTTEKGEFVLYFTGLTEDDIIKVNGKRYVKGNGDQTLTLEVTHPDYTSKQELIEEGVEESKTTSRLITI
jgi:hypothetical protein